MPNDIELSHMYVRYGIMIGPAAVYIADQDGAHFLGHVNSFGFIDSCCVANADDKLIVDYERHVKEFDEAQKEEIQEPINRQYNTRPPQIAVSLKCSQQNTRLLAKQADTRRRTRMLPRSKLRLSRESNKPP